MMVQFRQSNLFAEMVEVIGDDGIISHTSKENDRYLKYIRDGGVLLPAIPNAVLQYSEYRTIQPARLITTNNTATQIARYPLEQRTMYVAHFELDCSDLTNIAAGMAVRHIEGTVTSRRVNNGATMANPTVTVDHYIPAVSEVAPPMPVSGAIIGNDLVIRVTGIAGRTIHWYLSGKLKVVNTDGK